MQTKIRLPIAGSALAIALALAAAPPQAQEAGASPTTKSGAAALPDARKDPHGTPAGANAPLDAASAAAAVRNWQMRVAPGIERTWGVDVIDVRLTSSNWMLKFRYRVVDPAKSRVLLDAKSTAYLVDEASGARLAVPAMENIGELRQATQGTAGRQYFIMFGNGGQIVRKGSRVDVVIGAFHADGMIVE